jgi:CHAT domain-containing protein
LRNADYALLFNVLRCYSRGNLRIQVKYKALYEMGRLDEAEKGYQSMLDIQETRENGDIYWLILHDMGSLARKHGRLSEAVDDYAKAIDVIERYRSSINSEASKIGFIGDKSALYGDIVETLLQAGRPEEAYAYVERAKSRALVDLLAGQHDFATSSRTADLLKAYGDAEAKAHTQFLGDSEPAGERTASPLADSVARLREAEPELASLVSVSTASLQDIASRLAADEALVEYYYDSSALTAYVVHDGRVRAYPLMRPGLEADVQSLRSAIQERNRPAADPAAKLYARLVQPFAGDLTGVRRLTIVPHGVLHYLPFATLADHQVTLIDRFSLRMLPSASVIRYLKQGNDKNPAMLVVGNPSTDEAPLPFAEKEAESVAAGHPGATLWLGRAATETAFKDQAKRFGYLHLATHGVFDATAPLSSAMLLAHDGANDGRLTLSEIYDLRLSSDLVVLSACDTGLGVIAGGDDLIGLTRGFLYAGAHSIVASLWPVDDQATAELMTAFYAGLARMPKGEALRQAQMLVRQKYPAPYYWAGFFLTGSD